MNRHDPQRSSYHTQMNLCANRMDTSFAVKILSGSQNTGGICKFPAFSGVIDCHRRGAVGKRQRFYDSVAMANYKDAQSSRIFLINPQSP